MVFSSLVFLFVFLPLTLILYFACPGVRWKNALLILVSLFFYAWGEPTFVLVMVFSVLVNYVMCRLIGEVPPEQDTTQQANLYAKRRKILLVITLVFNLGLLGVYKYAGFAAENLYALLGIQREPPHFLLPLGISFFTFQALSYVIDAYRGKVPVQRNFAYLLLYISFFPQLVAGPIVRYETIQEQILHREHTLVRAGDGCRRFLLGLCKKVLLANQLAAFADTVFDLPHRNAASVTAWLALLAYALQIYFDFSGYSDMAIGLAKIFGFDFEENFNYPYIAKSVSEFWRRWHISLGSWFRDYVYFPLGGSRVGRAKEYRNLFVVWFLTGLWHGASWNFVFWGLYFAVFIALERLWLGKILQKNKLFAHIYLPLVALLGWVFFRANGLLDALSYFKLLVGLEGAGIVNAQTLTALRDQGLMLVFAAFASTRAPGVLFERLGEKHRAFAEILRAAVYTAGFGLVVIELVNSTYNPFIYFRF